ncbi:MAG: polysaccharide deacetylase family protein [Alphaproteobacteria bacterium]
MNRLCWLAVAMVLALAGPARADDGWVILTYHRFGQDQYPTTSVRLDQFDRQLAAIRDGGYTVLPLPELVAALNAGAPLPPRAVAITVDDAYTSLYREGWPRLRAHGFPFTLFVSTDAADDGAGDLMSWDQIREVAADPLVTIGHHAAAHAHMADLDLAAAAADLDRADARFAAELGHVPALFAYPYGEYGAALRDLVAGRGFAAAFGQQSGVVDRWADRYGLPRFPINANTAFDAFRLRLGAMPLPATESEPADLLVGDGNNPPAVSFRLVQPDDAGGPLRIDAMTCYFDGSPVAFSRDGDRIAIGLPRALGQGRSRLNCTMPAADGRWRWHGIQFYRP